jgi:transcriptional regulator with XRE-family HTH domain
MTLAEYVDQVMTQKGLDAVKVARASNGGISANYARKIRRGETLNPSIPLLEALAKGLDEDLKRLMKFAGASLKGPEDPWPAPILIRAMQKIVSSPDFTAIVKELMKLDNSGLKKAHQVLVASTRNDVT